MPRPLALITSAFLAAAPTVWAHEDGGSTIDPQARLSWGANIGWLDWRPSSESGARLGLHICSGHLYSPNAGWINLGDGAPANGIRYSNSAAEDFGVNVDPDGALRGLAYSANLGWIRFESQGHPQVNLATGIISGSVYSANAGWITLSTELAPLVTTRLNRGTDSDGDLIPDAWELERAGRLDALAAGGDADADGQSDAFEYLADTDPLSAADHLRILSLDLQAAPGHAIVSWTSKSTRAYQLEITRDFQAWEPAGPPVEFPAAGWAGQQAELGAPRGFFRVRASPPLP